MPHRDTSVAIKQAIKHALNATLGHKHLAIYQVNIQTQFLLHVPYYSTVEIGVYRITNL